MGNLSHLDALEAEAIYIIREVAAECEKPVMLYSIGKDSSVMLHLAMKAFYPEKPPFPFLHIDTTWKFKEMIKFRDETAKKLGIEMLTYTNEEGVKQGINPFDHGSAYTDIMKTQALKQALNKYFAKERPVIERDGNIIMVDDDRMRLLPGEKPQMKKVRFRTLGCYPLTGGVESDAETLDEIIEETLSAVESERTSRVIDHEEAGSMERRKKEGYF